MGQLNFFLTKNEVLDILNSLIATNELEIFAGSFFENEYPQPLEIITDLLEFDNLTFWLKNIIKEPKCSMLKSGANEGKFSFDYYKDPIIEFTDCKRTSSLMLPGRIFYKAGWIENEYLRKKHKNWCLKTSRLIDKRLAKIEGLWRISSEIESWVTDDGSLELGRGGKIINKEELNSIR